MDNFIQDFSEWIFRSPLVRFILTGAVISIFLLSIRKSWLIAIGKLPLLAPNWISIWRFPVVWVGFVMYLGYDAYYGFCLIVVGFAMDRLDGKMAHAFGDKVAEFESTFDELNHPGKTKIGGWLDPLIDKFTVVPILLYFCAWGHLWMPIGIAILGLELFSTAVRPPFNLGASYRRQIKASWFGKMKFLFQSITLVVYLPVDQTWVDPSIIPNVFLGGALTFCFLSVASRIKFPRPFLWVNYIVDRFAYVGRAFKHE